MSIRILIFLLFAFQFANAQSYSSPKFEQLVDSLLLSSSNFNHYSVVGRMENGWPMMKADTTYSIYAKTTGITIYNDEKFIDNPQHKLFMKICKKGKITDFIEMTNSKYPNIRVYGFWALLKNQFKDIKDVESKLSNDMGQVRSHAGGCFVLTYEVKEMIKKLK